MPNFRHLRVRVRALKAAVMKRRELALLPLLPVVALLTLLPQALDIVHFQVKHVLGSTKIKIKVSAEDKEENQDEEEQEQEQPRPSANTRNAPRKKTKRGRNSMF
jgi:hypothetical protein